MSPYEELGVEQDADDATIKSAYRRKASKSHPDREGGDEETFKRVKKAYEVLSDPHARAHYDQTGQTEKESGPSVNDIIAMVFAEAAEKLDVEHTDILAEVRKQFEYRAKAIRKEVKALRKSARTWRQMARRIKVKGHNVVKHMAEVKRKEVLHQYIVNRATRNMLKQALKMMSDWEYTVDEKPVEYAAGQRKYAQGSKEQVMLDILMRGFSI